MTLCISRRWKKLAITSRQANVKLNEDGSFTEDLIICRHAGGRFLSCRTARPTSSTFSPKQGRVPWPLRSFRFLENDDANRALMGSNMQRQAVPLIRAGSATRRHRHGKAWLPAISGAAIAAKPRRP